MLALFYAGLFLYQRYVPIKHILQVAVDLSSLDTTLARKHAFERYRLQTNVQITWNGSAGV
jgi:hypothetical protein